MIFLLVNAFMLFALYAFTGVLRIERLSARVVFIGLFFFAQIILTELILGIFSLLYLPVLAFLNLGIAAGLLIFSFRKTNVRTLAQEDSRIIREGLKEILCWENIILAGLGAFVSLWIFAAAYFLPPRGAADDLAYHLTFVYEFIVKHRFYLLPLYRHYYQFAFPVNAELLFMWPAIFFHNQQWVDAVQWVVAVFGATIVYALARIFSQERRLAAFVSLLFLFTPVVLHQAGCNYIDIIMNVFFLGTLYAGVQFYRTGRLPYAYLAGVSGGILIGIKYFMIAFWALLQFFILPRIIKERRKHLLVYLGIVVLLGGYWYVRNFILIGSPFYPINIFSRDCGVFWSGRHHFDILAEASDLINKVRLLGVRDLGLGSFNGGFGLAFWGIAFWCWLYVFLRSAGELGKHRKLFPFFFWGQVVFGFVLILLNPPREMEWSVRWGIYIIPVGFIAMAEVLRSLRHHAFFVNYVKAFCIFSSLLSVALLSNTCLPSYRLEPVIWDRLHARHPSEFRYFRYGCWVLPAMRYEAELLDSLTRGDAKGLSCYIASEATFFYLTNIYGSQFQNRVWNLEEQPSEKPDVYIHQTFETDEVKYLGRKIPLEDMTLDKDYELIIGMPTINLFLRKDVVTDPKYKSRLLAFYEGAYEDLLRSVGKAKAVLRPGIPLVVSGDSGPGWRYWSLKSDLPNKMYWVPAEFLDAFVQRNPCPVFYSFRPEAGYVSRKIYSFPLKYGEAVIYENTK